MKKTTLVIVLLWIVLAALAANIVMTLKFRSEQDAASLPCAAIPTRFVMEYPDCADKLLRSMNVTKLQIRSTRQPGRLSSGYGSETIQ